MTDKHRSKSRSRSKPREGLVSHLPHIPFLYQNHESQPSKVFQTLGKIFLDVFFGLLILYLIWIYLGHRMTINTEGLDMESPVGQVMVSILSLVLGVIAHKTGASVAAGLQHVVDTLMDLTRVQFKDGNPPAPTGFNGGGIQ